MALLIRNLSQIATPLGSSARRGRAMRDVAVVDDSVIVIDGERFAFIGRESDIPPDVKIDEDFDARRGTAVPGFVDSHTHIPFDGLRESEFNRRLQGETYEQIAASGGGIASTVRATRAASEERLVENVLARTATMARYGTTTAEAKSGYGLTLDAELKQLRAIRTAAARSPVRLVPTCLAAHEFPPESRGDAAARQRYVGTVIEEILPAVAEAKLAVFCDAFVERGVFTRAEGEARRALSPPRRAPSSDSGARCRSARPARGRRSSGRSRRAPHGDRSRARARRREASGGRAATR